MARPFRAFFDGLAIFLPRILCAQGSQRFPLPNMATQRARRKALGVHTGFPELSSVARSQRRHRYRGTCPSTNPKSPASFAVRSRSLLMQLEVRESHLATFAVMPEALARNASGDYRRNVDRKKTRPLQTDLRNYFARPDLERLTAQRTGLFG